MKRILCVFHYLAYCTSKQKDLIKKDMIAYSGDTCLADCLFKYKNFRNVFYFRIHNKFLRVICRTILKPNESVEIFGEIGGGLVLFHKMGCTINAKKIGENARIMQGVTIGKGKMTKIGNKPIIGDNTWLYTNSVIIGGVTVGNNCVVGANSVVLSDIPDNSIVVGAPARVVKKVQV